MYPLSEKSIEILDARLKDELTAFYNYNYLSTCCAAAGFFYAAEYFMRESKNEMCHAQMIQEYRLTRLEIGEEEPELPDLKQPHLDFTDLPSAIKIALDMEIELAKRYERSIADVLMNGDIMTFNFLMQFMDIQKESIKEFSEKNIIFKSLTNVKEQREMEKDIFKIPESTEPKTAA